MSSHREALGAGVGLPGELASEHSLPAVGPHGRLKSWLPWAQGDSCPHPQARVTPGGWGPVGGEGQVGLAHLLLPHSVKYLLSTYFVSGVGIRREEEVGFRLGKRQAYPQALIK